MIILQNKQLLLGVFIFKITILTIPLLWRFMLRQANQEDECSVPTGNTLC